MMFVVSTDRCPCLFEKFETCCASFHDPSNFLPITKWKESGESGVLSLETPLECARYMRTETCVWPRIGSTEDVLLFVVQLFTATWSTQEGGSLTALLMGIPKARWQQYIRRANEYKFPWRQQVCEDFRLDKVSVVVLLQKNNNFRCVNLTQQTFCHLEPLVHVFLDTDDQLGGVFVEGFVVYYSFVLFPNHCVHAFCS